MDTYYTVSIVMTWMACVVMFVQLRGDSNLPVRDRIGFLVSFILIVVGSFCEWAGVFLDSGHADMRWAHLLVKFVELSLVPILPVAFASIIGSPHRSRFVAPILCLNIVLEFASMFFGFIYSVDAAGVYHHGSFYWIYIASYLVGIVYLFAEAVRVGGLYQNSNRLTLLVILLFLFAGIAIELLLDGVRMAWCFICITCILIHVYYTQLVLQVDTLTGLLSRTTYENDMGRINYSTAIIILDVDDFKSINDTYGHQYGDLCLSTVARCIHEGYAKKGKCYRIGGDEFCVILKRGRLGVPAAAYEDYTNPETGETFTLPAPTPMITELNKGFNAALKAAQEVDPHLPDASLGYGYYHGNGSLEEAIEESDKLMYKKKEARKAARRATASASAQQD